MLAGLGLLLSGCTGMSGSATAAGASVAEGTGNGGGSFDAGGWQAADPADSDDDTRCDEVDDLGTCSLPARHARTSRRCSDRASARTTARSSG